MIEYLCDLPTLARIQDPHSVGVCTLTNNAFQPGNRTPFHLWSDRHLQLLIKLFVSRCVPNGSACACIIAINWASDTTNPLVLVVFTAVRRDSHDVAALVNMEHVLLPSEPQARSVPVISRFLRQRLLSGSKWLADTKPRRLETMNPMAPEHPALSR